MLHLTPLCNKEGSVEMLVAVCVLSRSRVIEQELIFARRAGLGRSAWSDGWLRLDE